MNAEQMATAFLTLMLSWWGLVILFFVITFIGSICAISACARSGKILDILEGRTENHR